MTMPKTTEKPREFWICDNGVCLQSPPIYKSVHVIEYAAFEKLKDENERLKSKLSIADLKTHKEKTLRILALLNECDTLKAKLAEVEAELDNKRGAMMLEIKRLHELADREREAAKVMREALEQIQSLAANEHEQGDSKALDDVLDLTCETFKALAKADEIRGGE